MCTTLVTAFKRGDPAAFPALFDHVHARVLAHAGRRLVGRGGTACDAEEVASSALAELFRAVTAGAGLRDELSDTASLFRALYLLTGHKAARRLRYLRRQMRDPRRRGPLPADLADGIAAGRHGRQLALDEALGRLDPDHRPVADLLAAGYTRAEVAARLGCGERTVYRRLDVIRGVLAAAGFGG